MNNCKNCSKYPCQYFKENQGSEIKCIDWIHSFTQLINVDKNNLSIFDLNITNKENIK